MAEYIAKETAIAKLTALEVTDELATMADAKRVLADMTAADVVPVEHGLESFIRCKDCKYAAKAQWNKKGYRICPASHMEITDDGFCSYGERRESK